MLTAYVEAVKYSGQSSNLPDSFTRLPLHRVDDVEVLFEELATELDMLSWSETDRGCSVLGEAADIFAAALSRLCSLGHQSHARAMELKRLTQDAMRRIRHDRAGQEFQD